MSPSTLVVVLVTVGESRGVSILEMNWVGIREAVIASVSSISWRIEAVVGPMVRVGVLMNFSLSEGGGGLGMFV